MPEPKAKILIAEDEPHLRQVLSLQLSAAGFEVFETCDGAQAVERAPVFMPDLVMLDVMMPNMDGYEALRQLRASYLTRHIPIIMLTARAETEDKLQGLRGGANDYVTKPWESRELLQRVRNALEWSRQQRAASPLTGLPGNLAIDAEIQRRIERNEAFAFLAVDIDSFKSFNDHYGYARGDDAIRNLAHIVVDATTKSGRPGDFVGHIGGDDFVLLTAPECGREIAEAVVKAFDELSPTMYDPEDRARGYIEALNRRHEIDRFPLMSVTIALVSTDSYPITHQAELNDKAQELKEHGKGILGSIVVGERRTRGPGEGEAERDVA
ncbi:MAG: response regulator [Candidatus Eisenbacteria bacterium]